MKKVQGEVTETRRRSRIFGVLAMLFVVSWLIGGIEAFAPASELDDFERASVDVVLVEAVNLKDDGSVRVAGRKHSVAELQTGAEYPLIQAIHADAQVVTALRNSGIQRARHPTGPPATLA